MIKKKFKFTVKLEKVGMITTFDCNDKEYILKCWKKRKDIILKNLNGDIFIYKTKSFICIEINKN